LELNDAARRIGGQYWRMILVCVALGVCLALVAHLPDVDTYTASTRLTLDAKDPEDRAESESIADTANAIATSPARVKAALRTAHVIGRDPFEMAEHGVTVQGVGSSSVLELSVSDADPEIAAAVANALARGVIRTRANVTGGELRQVVADLDRRIDRLNRKIGRESRAVAGGEAAASETLIQQRASLESARVTALSNDAQRPKASIVSPATPPLRVDASRRLPDALLGGLLGLILGVGLAALLETIRPTLVGSDALTRELNAPLLGTLPNGANDGAGSGQTKEIAGRIGLAARAADVQSVGLVSSRRDLDLSHLASYLDAPLKVRPFDFHSSSNGHPPGLVLVSPDTLKRDELDEVVHLLRVSPGPLLGVVTYSHRASETASFASSLHEAPTQLQ